MAAEARVDTLTGVLNRRGFEERAATELLRAERDRASIAIVSFDIDYFKRINDEWGHEAGDRVLTRLGEVFRRHTRGGDLVARMGGEEFVALLWASDLDNGHAYAEKMRSAIRRVDDLGVGRVTISAGVASAAAPASVAALLLAADSALYAAKSAGRDQTVVDTRLEIAPVLAD